MNILPGVGVEGCALQLGNPISPLQMYRAGDVPRVEYDFIRLMPGFMMCIPMFYLHSLCTQSETINCRNILIRTQSIVSV